MKLDELLKRRGKTIEKDKGDHVFMQGEADKSLYHVGSGLLKAYYTSEEGKEFIKSFLLPGDLIGSMTSVVSEGNCSFSLVCLESTSLVRIPFEVLQEHSRHDLEIANAMIELLIHLSMKKEKREFELLCLSAEERFGRLLKSTPILLERVTQNDLARYLGITPAGLSRIKKRMYSKGSQGTLQAHPLKRSRLS